MVKICPEDNLFERGRVLHAPREKSLKYFGHRQVFVAQLKVEWLHTASVLGVIIAESIRQASETNIRYLEIGIGNK